MCICRSTVGDVVEIVLVLAASYKIVIKEGLLCSRTLFQLCFQSVLAILEDPAPFLNDISLNIQELAATAAFLRTAALLAR